MATHYKNAPWLLLLLSPVHGPTQDATRMYRNRSKPLSIGIGLLGGSEATNGRALTGAAKTDNTAMTDEACVNYCISKSFNFAGIEYASECCKLLRKPPVIFFTCLT